SIVRLRQGGPDREGYVAAAAGVTYLVPRPARPAYGPGVPGCRTACVLNSLAAGILVVVAMGTVSPVFAGREHELEVLAGAFTAAARGTPAFVLVGAEAGGGKSRLASEFAASVSGRALLLTGGCVELSGPGLPYAPFAAAVRGLVRERGAAEGAAPLPGQGAGGLAPLPPRRRGPPRPARPG